MPRTNFSSSRTWIASFDEDGCSGRSSDATTRSTASTSSSCGCAGLATAQRGQVHVRHPEDCRAFAVGPQPGPTTGRAGGRSVRDGTWHLFVEAGLIRGRIAPAPTAGLRSWLAWGLVGYSALAYPLLGLALGHRYPAMPMFGITPCPLIIFTFGMLMLAGGQVPRRLLVIPGAWSLIGGSAAFLLDVPQDWLLLGSGLWVLVLWTRRNVRCGPTLPA